jgi:hypothetical protein
LAEPALAHRLRPPSPTRPSRAGANGEQVRSTRPARIDGFWDQSCSCRQVGSRAR